MLHDVIPPVPGIYCILNTVNNKCYIGSSQNLYNRLMRHQYYLRYQRHPNPIVQNAWNTYGEEAFLFFVLELVPSVDVLVVREQHYLDSICPEYNIRKVAESNHGLKASAETKQLLSDIRRGKKKIPWTPERRERTVASHKGYRPSPESIAQGAATRRGYKHTPEARAKMAAKATGKTHTPEARAKLSEAKKGKPLHPEHAANVRAANARLKGIPRSEETRAKISAAQKGKPGHSPEVIERANRKRRGQKRSPEVIAKMSGRTMSPEQRAAMSAQRKGKPGIAHPQTTETRAKIAATLKGKPKSPEHVAKVAEANRGKQRKPYSEEYKRNMSAIQKKRFATLKQTTAQASSWNENTV